MDLKIRKNGWVQFSTNLMALRWSDTSTAAGDWVKPSLLLVSPDNAEWTHSSLWLIFHLMSWLPLREMERVIIQTDKGMRWLKEGHRGLLYDCILCVFPAKHITGCFSLKQLVDGLMDAWMGRHMSQWMLICDACLLIDEHRVSFLNLACWRGS